MKEKEIKQRLTLLELSLVKTDALLSKTVETLSLLTKAYFLLSDNELGLLTDYPQKQIGVV
jgi:hypothetical protein